MIKINIRDFRRVLFFTGAGMSAESGVPTYRGQGGIWNQYDFQEYACQEAFEKDPRKVWEFHNKRREMVASCEPNRGHAFIAQLEKEIEEVTIVTQNIDGLHQRAGSSEVYELHGSLWRLRCPQCRVFEENFDAPLRTLQHSCGSYWRPDIVWFGDNLNHETIYAAIEKIKNTDLLISIGTSAVVYPAAEFPLFAKENGAILVEINPQETPLSEIFDLCLRGSAGEVLPTLLS